MAYMAERTSGENKSYWIESTETIEYQKLNSNLSADVVIIGAGISGLTTAYLLAKSGKKVIIIEDGYIGSGETGRTTAHISNALDDRYYEIENLFDREGAEIAAESHTAAINMVERIVTEENIDCNFFRLDGYLFLHPSDNKENIYKEYNAAIRAGINVSLTTDIPGISGAAVPAIKFPDQATFHPMKYLKGLCDSITKYGGKIFTLTHAADIEENLVKTEDGFSLTADNIVVATNTPFNNRFTMHTKQAPYRTYVIGARIKKGRAPYNLWWDTGDMNSEWPTYPYHFVRLLPYEDNFDLLLAGGEDHKTGQRDEENKNEEERYANLVEWTKKHFPYIEEIDYRWSGQVMEPVDDLGFIGKNPTGPDNVYIITGDSGNGMTHGTIGGMLITDLINGLPNRWAKLYDPSRKTLKTADVFIEEQMNVAKQYLDYLTPGDIKSVKDLPPDSGAIIQNGTSKAAVYREKGGRLYSFSAVCPHLKCIIQWNPDEKTFDCPCHGSRFSNYGKVVNGPAVTDLEEIELKEE